MHPPIDTISLEYPSRPELAIAALLFMLTKVADKSSSAITASIAAHLEYIARDERHPTALREAAQRMASDWIGSQPQQQQLH